MALHWPTFFTRLGSAIVFSTVMMAGLLWNEWAFLVLVALIMVLCLRDYFRLGKKLIERPIAGFQITVVIVASLIALLLSSIAVAVSVVPGWNVPLLPSILQALFAVHMWPLLLTVPIILLLQSGLSKNGDLRAGLISCGGFFYVTLPILLLQELREIHWAWPLALILMIWMNDTMAYLVGSFIGKTPFSPISPKKTWEGTAGGAILTIAGAAIWGYFSEKFRIADAVAVALCAAVAGTAGDLFESKLKRLAGVKDSGTLMPGHGGALDRFDSLLVATPFAFCYLYIVSL